MTDAIAARQHGDEYQAYLFWKEACSLLANRGIARVGFEVDGFRAFDDVVVEYRSPRTDGRGGLVNSDHWQVKFSATFGKELTCEGLMDPATINATTTSLLQRLKDAVKNSQTDGQNRRFILVCPWKTASGDLLGEMHDTTTGALRIDKLFEGKTGASKSGKVRLAWMEHLEITDERELRTILSSFCIRYRHETLEELLKDLALMLNGVRLIPPGAGQRTDRYSQLIWRLMQEGRQWFQPHDIEQVCRAEGLWNDSAVTVAATQTRLGIRTFMRWAENLEDDTDDMVCLSHHFSERLIASPDLWNSALVPAVVAFLNKHVCAHSEFTFTIPAHSCVAFLLGWLLEPKLGARVGVTQGGIRGTSEVWWRDAATDGVMAELKVAVTEFDQHKKELAVAFSITHDIEQDVSSFVRAKLPMAKRLAHVSLETPSQSSVTGSGHAVKLAERAFAIIQEEVKRGGPYDTVHLFWSAPNGFAVFLGQLCRSLGTCELYEFDFDRQGGERYSTALSLTPQLRLS